MTIYLGSSIVPTKGPAMKPGKIPERTWTKDEAEAETFAGSRIHQDCTIFEMCLYYLP